MLPLSIFSSSQFTATNVVTFIVYGAFGLVFLLVVVQLQVVAGYAPLTTTALASAPADHAGLASGVNNAVARVGGAWPASDRPTVRPGGPPAWHRARRLLVAEEAEVGGRHPGEAPCACRIRNEACVPRPGRIHAPGHPVAAGRWSASRRASV